MERLSYVVPVVETLYIEADRGFAASGEADDPWGSSDFDLVKGDADYEFE